MKKFAVQDLQACESKHEFSAHSQIENISEERDFSSNKMFCALDYLNLHRSPIKEYKKMLHKS